MSLMYKKNLASKRGFTLLEVLITLVIMSIGLLGVAALQISSLRSNLSAEHRGQATQLAYSMADRMRVNRSYVIDNNGGNYESTDPATAAAQASCGTGPVGCSPANMALQDLFEWNQNIVNGLPGGVGTINVSGAASTAVYTINVQWVDTSGSTRALNAGFDLEFQP